MGILDELREEAAKKQDEASIQKNIEQELALIYRQEVLPRMQHAFQFMKELVEHLNFLDQAVEINDYSYLYPQFGTLVQGDYKINTDGYMGFADIDRLMQINVSYVCLGEGEFYLQKEGKGAIEREIAFWHEKKVAFDWKPVLGKGGQHGALFTIQKRFPVHLRFEVDYPQSKIKLLMRNHKNFDLINKSFDPKDVDDLLLDEIARFMLRKDFDFIRLPISDAHRRDIQRRLETQQREHIKMLQQIEQEQPETEVAKKKSFLRFLPLNKFTK